jgi:hypothetical protein
MPDFFITRTADQDPHGPGFYSIPDMPDDMEARIVAFQHFGAKWSGMYSNIFQIHPNDRKRLGTLGPIEGD